MTPFLGQTSTSTMQHVLEEPSWHPICCWKGTILPHTISVSEHNKEGHDTMMVILSSMKGMYLAIGWMSRKWTKPARHLQPLPFLTVLISPPALLHAWVFPPLPTSSTSAIPDHSKDLVMGVLSIQVSNKADVVSLVTRPENCFSVSGVWWKRLLHECAAERQELCTKSWACSRGSSFEQLQWFLLP